MSKKEKELKIEINWWFFAPFIIGSVGIVVWFLLK